jgi:hypothetical protein
MEPSESALVQAMRYRAVEFGMDTAASRALQQGLCRHAQRHDCSEQLRLFMNATKDHI